MSVWNKYIKILSFYKNVLNFDEKINIYDML